MSKHVFAGGGAIHTLCSRAEGTGVNTPSVCIAIEGNGSRPSHIGSGVSDRGAQFTLNRIEQHGVAYESKCFENHGQDSRIKPIEVSDTRNQKDGTGGNNLPLVVFSKVSHPHGKNGDGERWDRREVAQTRNTFDNSEVRTQECVDSIAQNTRDELRIINGDGSIAGALPAEPGTKQQTYLVHRFLATMRYIVRRLTPIECERLMGLPDDYCIPTGLRRFFDADGEPSPALVAEFQRIHDTFGAIMAEYEHAKPPKPKTAAQVQKWLAKIADPATCPDSPRYKGCGNGWATNQPRWILMRLLNAEGIEW